MKGSRQECNDGVNKPFLSRANTTFSNSGKDYFENELYGVETLPPSIDVGYQELYDFHKTGGCRQLIDAVYAKIVDTNNSKYWPFQIGVNDQYPNQHRFSYRLEHCVRWPNGLFIVRALLGSFFDVEHAPNKTTGATGGALSSDATLLFSSLLSSNSCNSMEKVGSKKLLITLKLSPNGELVSQSERFQIFTHDQQLNSSEYGKTHLYVQPSKIPPMVFFIQSQDDQNEHRLKRMESTNSVRMSGIFATASSSDWSSGLRHPNETRHVFTKEQFESFEDTYTKTLKMVDCRRLGFMDKNIKNSIIEALQEKVNAHDYNGRSFLLSTVTLGTFLYAIEYLHVFADDSVVLTLSMGRYDDGLSSLHNHGDHASTKDFNLKLVHLSNPQDRIDIYLRRMLCELSAAWNTSVSKKKIYMNFTIQPASYHFAQYLSPEDARYCNWDYSSPNFPIQASYSIKESTVKLVTIITKDDSTIEIVNIGMSHRYRLAKNVATVVNGCQFVCQEEANGCYRCRLSSLEALQMLKELMEANEAAQFIADSFLLSPSLVDTAIIVMLYDITMTIQSPLETSTIGAIQVLHQEKNDTDYNPGIDNTDPFVVTVWNTTRDNATKTVGLTVHNLFSTRCVAYIELCLNDDTSVEWNAFVSHLSSFPFVDNKAILVLAVKVSSCHKAHHHHWKYSHTSVYCLELNRQSDLPFIYKSINLNNIPHWNVDLDSDRERNICCLESKHNVIYISMTTTTTHYCQSEYFIVDLNLNALDSNSTNMVLNPLVINPLQLNSSIVDSLENNQVVFIVPTNNVMEMFTVVNHHNHIQMKTTSVIWYWKANIHNESLTWFSIEFGNEHSDQITCVAYSQLNYKDKHTCEGKDWFTKFNRLFYPSEQDSKVLNHVNILATGSIDRRVIIWDVTNPNHPTMTWWLKDHEAALCDVKISACDYTVISMSVDSVILFNCLLSGECYRKLSQDCCWKSLDLLTVFNGSKSIGSMLVGTSEEKGIVVWNGLSNHRHGCYTNTSTITTISPYDNTSVIVASNTSLNAVDYSGNVTTLCQLLNPSHNLHMQVNCVAVVRHNDNSNILLIVALSDGNICIYSNNTDNNNDDLFVVTETIKSHMVIRSLAAHYSSVSNDIAIYAGGSNHLGFGLKCWLRTKQSPDTFEEFVIPGHDDIEYSVIQLHVVGNSGIQPCLVVAYDNGHIKLFNIPDLQLLHVLHEEGKNGFYSLSAIEINEEHIDKNISYNVIVACVCDDNVVACWKIPISLLSSEPSTSSNEMLPLSSLCSINTGESVSAITLVRGIEKCCSLNDVLLVIAMADTLITVWNIVAQQMIHVIGSHTARITHLHATTPRMGQRPVLFSVSDNRCRMWNDGLTNCMQPPSKHAIIQIFYSDIIRQNQWLQCKKLLQCYPNLFNEMPQLFYLALIEREETFFLEFAPQLIKVIAFIPSYPRAIYTNKKRKACRWIHHKPHPNSPVDIMEYAMHTRALIALRAILLAWCEVLNQDIHHQVSQKLLYPSRVFNEKVLFELAVFFPVEYTEFLLSIRLIHAHRSVESVKHNLFRVIPNAKRTGIFGSNYFRDNAELDEEYRPSIHIRGIKAGRYLSHLYTAITMRIYNALMTFKLVVVKGEDFDKQAVMPFMLPIKRFVDIRQLYVAVKSSDELKSVEIFDSDILRVAIKHYWNVHGFQLYRLNLLQYFATVVTFVNSIYLYGRAISSDGVDLVLLLQAKRSIAAFLFFMAWFGIDEVCQVIGKYWKIYKHNRTYARLFHIVFSHFVLDFWNIIDCSIVISGTLGSYRRHMELDECYSGSSLIAIPSYDSVGALIGTTYRCNLGVESSSISSCLLATTAALLWFKVLYYLRPIKASGQFVVMVTVIMTDIKYFLIVLVFVLVGFAQGFWLLLSQTNTSSNFASIKKSFFATFMFMFGQLDMEELSESQSEGFTKVFLVAFMFTIMLLLFNLLIALMGESFSKTNEKIEAYYLKELASFMVDQTILTPILATLRLLGLFDYEKDDFIHVIKYASDVSSNRNRLTHEVGVTEDADDPEEEMIESTSEDGKWSLSTSHSSRLLRQSFDVCVKTVKSTASSVNHNFRALHKPSFHNDIIGRLTRHHGRKMSSSSPTHISLRLSSFLRQELPRPPSQALLSRHKSFAIDFYGDGIHNAPDDDIDGFNPNH